MTVVFPFFFIIIFIYVIIFAIKASGNSGYHMEGENITMPYENTTYNSEGVKSYYISSNLFSFSKKTEITDEYGNLVYNTQTAVLSFTDDTTITKANGDFVCNITRSIFSIHQRHTIEMRDGRQLSITKELFHPFSKVINIEEIGWQLRGDLFAFRFEVEDANGRVVAIIGQKPFSIHDKYSVDIYDLSNEELIIGIVIAVKHMIADSKNSSSSSSSSSN